MSYDKFYLQDVELAKFYRQAYEMKEDRKTHIYGYKKCMFMMPFLRHYIMYFAENQGNKQRHIHQNHIH